MIVNESNGGDPDPIPLKGGLPPPFIDARRGRYTVKKRERVKISRIRGSTELFQCRRALLNVLRAS